MEFKGKAYQSCLFYMGGGGKLSKLTLRQKKFADEYIISGNAYKSAVSAGYSQKYAKTDSHKLLENTRIKSYIDERLAKLDSEKIADQKEVLSYLTSVMRGEQTEQTLRGEGEGLQSLIDIDVGAKDRIKAAELLGKRHRLWTDKQELDVTATVVFEGDEDVPD
ncbi:terminase small subunit [Streptococcus sp. zg-JUN1979]|uniref:terminase small subunit n=1 Tax=Streptococcus sp. zg-JUN1979 TaxID=3391450 RepID=UPI0039A4A10C